MGKAHKHAEVIKAWADDITQTVQVEIDGEWCNIVDPGTFVDHLLYRIKTKPEYPKTLMSRHELFNAGGCAENHFSELLMTANAAIRHAIDSGQVIIAPKGE